MRKKIRYAHLRGLAAIRLKLGISQRQMAIELGVPQSTYGMAEWGRRNLSAGAQLRLAELELALSHTDMKTNISPATEFLPVLLNDDCTANQLRRLNCEKKLLLAVTNLDRIEKNYSIAMESLESLEKIELSVGTFSLDKHRDSLLLKLVKNGPQVQEKLKTRIALLNAEIEIMLKCMEAKNGGTG